MSTKNKFTLQEMYILKIKGKAKIPDYIQLRDEHLTLLGYFRVDRPERSLEKLGFQENMEEIIQLFQSMPFGKIQKLTIDVR